MRVRRPFALVLLAQLALWGCGGTDPQPDADRRGGRGEEVAASALPPPSAAPRLMVLVVVDQLRFDYLERMAGLWEGGIARLLAEGVLFTDAHHDHAVTNTAPGHAAVATGVHPARSGIVDNVWYDQEEGDWVYCVEDADEVTSPRRLLVDGLADWWRERYPAGKVFAASGKDRGAVFLGGHRPDGAFWFDDETGGFETDDDYYREAPYWVGEHAAEHRWGAPFGSGLWEPLPVDPAAAAAAGFRPFDRGPFDNGMPRLVGRATPVPDERFWDDVYRTPYLDHRLGRFARDLVVYEELGADEWPDLLALSFSGLDTVGHEYGPASLEVLDALLRLDRELGDLFALLDERVGEGRWAAALTSDHGVVPVPEVAAAAGEPGRRVDAEQVACVRRAGVALAERFGPDLWQGGALVLDDEALAARGHERREVEAAVRTALEACPGVERVWPASELRTLASARDRMATLYRHSHHPGRGPDFYVQYEPHHLQVPGHQTTHGSPHSYDTHVPLFVLAPGLAPGRTAARVETVDVAPTLAALAGVPVPDDLDGQDLANLAGWSSGRR